ncbi:DMT family transporter [Paracoccus versutus]|uniref:DMT family transporter n=1 Tax=Paracoccus versutus TaxID=34007 RepID=UPI001FB65485|nr:DMT family transporter [Paracoccus versutus]MCJ1901703.1 DMT family transporter [Paracoccus versutus]
MTGELLALCSALFYGLAGVTISRGKTDSRGDNGVFLSVIVTCVLTLGLWSLWGRASLPELITWDQVPALGLFALAGVFSTVLGRTTMYRATERIGAVKAALFRRLIPVFALPCAFLLLGEWPGPRVLTGGAIIMLGVLCYQLLPRQVSLARNLAGDLIGITSALFYALAYAFRRMGLEGIPDPLFGTFVGAVVGLAWFSTVAAVSKAPAGAFRRLVIDRGAWHWASALSLGIGQTLQFFALSLVPVSTVAVLGALDLFFSAAFIALFLKGERIDTWRLGLAGGLALLGSTILFS